MTKITELGYLTIGVSDLEAWERFATQILGAEIRPGEDENSRYLRLDYWHHRIKFVQDASDDVLVTGFRVAGVVEFREMLEKLKDAGVEIRVGSPEEATARHVLEVMFLQDPNGYDIEIFHGPLVLYDQPFHPGRMMHGRFKTGTGGMGHLFQNIRSGYEETHAFYTLLGFRGSVEYKMPLPMAPAPVELMFFHCNERQHSVAFGPPSEKRGNHILFEVERMEDVGLAYDLVKQAGIPVIIEPGSHANDQMYSFYFRNPSGFMSEIGWGARQPTGQSEYYHGDSFGHAPRIETMKGFMVPA
mgnify:FL=1